jgi:hypothetical protein
MLGVVRRNGRLTSNFSGSLLLWTGLEFEFYLTAANWTARLHEHVVLPTPPFPPTNIHFKLVWSSMFCNEGSSAMSSLVFCNDCTEAQRTS